MQENGIRTVDRNIIFQNHTKKHRNAVLFVFYSVTVGLLTACSNAMLGNSHFIVSVYSVSNFFNFAKNNSKSGTCRNRCRQAENGFCD